MSSLIYTLRLNADGTLTIRVGRRVEYVTLAGKERGEIFDAVKYALISKDAFFSNDRLTRDLYEIVWQYV
jgi:hypothetical protein